MSEETIFAEALERRFPAERDAYLRDACDGDPALRRRVEALLAAHEQSGDLLDPPPFAPGPRAEHASAAGDGRPIAEGPGARVGPYTIVRKIGEGGMGVVFLAQQERPVRRTVALKVIRPGMDSAQIIARLEAERQTLALMDHPHIARFLDAGTTDSGRPFFVMEPVDGIPITEYCDRHRLTTRQRLELFEPVCRAIQHAHQKGIIHRDLKPSNVLVAGCDGTPVPRVIDFGVAKATGPDLAERATLTGDGLLIGTLEYMSPEQASFHAADIDTRSDIYSLGVILYELLTGTTPFRKGRLGGLALDEVLRVIREEEPPRPSTRLGEPDAPPGQEAGRPPSPGPAALTRQVRGDLDWIVMKCLEKDRARRYESADALARDIRRHLADEAVEASPPSVVYRLSKLLRRHRGPALAASIIVLLLAGGIVGTTLGLLQAVAARQAEAQRAEGERLAKEMAERRLTQIEKGIVILGSIFEDLDPQAEQKEERPLRAILGDRLDRAAAELDGEAVGDPLVVAGLQDRLGRTNLGLGRAGEAKELFTRAMAVREARLGADHPDTLATRSRLAVALKELGRASEAIALAERVKDAQVRVLGFEHPDTLATLSSLGITYAYVGRYDDAIALLERVGDVLNRTRGPDDDLALDALADLAGIYVFSGRHREGIALAERVRDARVKRHGKDHPLAIVALSRLGYLYQAVGRMREALALFERARDEIVPRLGAEHPSTLTVLENLAAIDRAFGRKDEAIALGERVRDARVRTLGAHHPRTLHTLNSLGLSHMNAGQPKKALPLFRQAVAGLEEHQFAYDEAGQIIANLCECLETSGQTGEADDWRRKWIAAARTKYGPGSIAYAGELEEQGFSLLDRKRPAEAEPLLRECLAIRRKAQPEVWTTFHAQSLLGAALLDRGAYAEAEPLLIGGYEGLKAREDRIPRFYVHYRLAQAGARIVRLYEATARPQKAAEWRSKLDGSHTGHRTPSRTGSTP